MRSEFYIILYLNSISHKYNIILNILPQNQLIFKKKYEHIHKLKYSTAPKSLHRAQAQRNRYVNSTLPFIYLYRYILKKYIFKTYIKYTHTLKSVPLQKGNLITHNAQPHSNATPLNREGISLYASLNVASDRN